MAKVYYKFISGGQMQLRLGIWQRVSLLVGEPAIHTAAVKEIDLLSILGAETNSLPNCRTALV